MNGCCFRWLTIRSRGRPRRTAALINRCVGIKMISVITPAHNEILFIKKCLCSVKTAAKEVSAEVLNCCMDRTGDIASEPGEKVITEDARNMSRIRYKGA